MNCRFRIPMPMWMVAAAAIFFGFLSLGLARAQAPAPWAQGTRDSVETLLTARQFAPAIALARQLVQQLRAEGAQGPDLAQGLELYARSLRRGGKARQPETLTIAQAALSACAGPPPAEPGLTAACRNTLGL